MSDNRNKNADESAMDAANELYDSMMADVPDDCRDAYEHELLTETEDDL